MRLTWIPGDDNNSPITGQPRACADQERGTQPGGRPGPWLWAPPPPHLACTLGCRQDGGRGLSPVLCLGRVHVPLSPHGRLSVLLGTRGNLGKELTDSAPQTVPTSLPPQTTSSSLKKTSSSQGSGTTIPSSRAVSTQLCSGCHPTSTTSSGSSPSMRWAAATPASHLSATEPAEHVSA